MSAELIRTPRRVLPTLVLAQLAGTSTWFAVNAVMRRNISTVGMSTDLDSLRHLLQDSTVGELFVVRDDGSLHGTITLQDLSDLAFDHDLDALVNAGGHLLGEGVALRPGDIDVVYHFGYSFPIYRGGPMHYADQVGVNNVYQAVVGFHEQYGKLWEPAPLLEKLVAEGKGFASLQ